MVFPILRARCFGHFSVAGTDDWQQGPPEKRSREILQYLVLHAKGIAPRERLGDFLWPGETSGTVQHRLHSAVSGARTFLRRLLGGFNAIRCGSEGYSWDPSLRLDVDLDHFERLYHDGTTAATEEAVLLYRGELFDGQDGDWVRPARLKYAFMYAAMVERRAVGAFAARRFEQALHGALELLEIDQAHESASRLAIRCFDALGQRRRALDAYASLREYLHDHLGVEPTPETTELIRTVMQPSA